MKGGRQAPLKMYNTVFVIVLLLLIFLFLWFITTPHTTCNTSKTIYVPIKIHLVQSSPHYSANQTPSQVLQTLQQTNNIWAQANIVFYPLEILYTPIDPNLLNSLFYSNSLSVIHSIPHFDPHVINVFFVNSIVPNVRGRDFLNRNILFIAHLPHEPQPRALAHELAHALSIPHTSPDHPENLMTPGALGTLLTPSQICQGRTTFPL